MLNTLRRFLHRIFYYEPCQDGIIHRMRALDLPVTVYPRPRPERTVTAIEREEKQEREVEEALRRIEIESISDESARR